ncbi:MAG: acyl-CoA dehydrogenase family protein, partial [Acidimicrobiales bacterium]
MRAPDLDLAGRALERAERVVAGAVRALRHAGGPDAHQALAYDIAHGASALAVARAGLDYGSRGDVEASLAWAFCGLALSDLAARVLGREAQWDVDAAWWSDVADVVAAARDPEFLAGLAETPGPRHLGPDFDMVASTFHRFAEERVLPHAERVHRHNEDIPEAVIDGLAQLGGFGLSVPEAHGGFSTGGETEYVGMVVATEELSWASLGVGGSLITRPEILTRALLAGGTDEQRARWLPALADASVLAAIAVTEPDYGSDVAGIATSATRTAGGWLLRGVKTWCTFAARANVLVVLARTDPDRALAHRGLSLFMVEKPPAAGAGFAFTQDARAEGRADPDGKMEGRAIDTLGYRGMHSYELAFENWAVPAENLVGGEEGLGKGFYLQMQGFE